MAGDGGLVDIRKRKRGVVGGTGVETVYLGGKGGAMEWEGCGEGGGRGRVGEKDRR